MVYEEIICNVIEGEAEKVVELSKQALAKGYPATVILEKGLLAGINKVADKFRNQRVMVPEVLMSARAMNAGLSILEPRIKAKKKWGRRGSVVIGTVAGDLHDIGKNLVKMMIMTTGVRIIDLGVDVSSKKFVHIVQKEKPDMLMMAALLTTTMPMMKQVIDELIEAGIRPGVKIAVGGAPVQENFSREIGADYYFESAAEVKHFLDENIGKIIAHRKT
ncbi:Methionine synthase [Sporomusa acidovorans DSM 3132]|uniref:Methionine synthase n=2 Tax=Sporomusa TaxID=2375 RepID=A0ABZ3J815_SPOA4|nr:corrinoid protein [Sporomusa acidovorans]OZC21215.1 methionine synthase [Sporomusa acidovorans DSM 3132]SDE64963.1 methyltransferase cognate corrinoid proteins [Sporomusa acidovorans]